MTKLRTFVFLLTAFFASSTASFAQAGETQVEWYGHAAFKITTPSGKVLLVDPWLQNPLNKTGAADVAALTKVDLILISHGHFDHVGDAVAIAKTTKAQLVATGDLGAGLVQYSGYPKDQAGYGTLGNAGGSITVLDGEVTIVYAPALHSSGITAADGSLHEGGNAGGFIIKIKNGPTIYHTGDTGLFSDMALYAKNYPVDLMLCCIGDHFVMSPEQAAEAVKMVNPKQVVPMHFQTFPVLTGTSQAFQAALAKQGLAGKLKVMEVHGTLSL